VRGFIGVLVPSAVSQVPTRDFRTILSIFPNSPAEAAGVAAGDYILAVDGKSTATMQEYLELVHALQGAPGSVVRLQLKRIADGQIETLAITRGKQFFGPGFPK
jgi:C-terminal processing protease CtpA/Prc